MIKRYRECNPCDLRKGSNDDPVRRRGQNTRTSIRQYAMSISKKPHNLPTSAEEVPPNVVDNNQKTRNKQMKKRETKEYRISSEVSDILDQQFVESYPPASTEEFAKNYGLNGARYLAPVVMETPCEEDFYWRMEPLARAILNDVPYDAACDFVAQAFRRVVLTRPQSFLEELTHQMRIVEPLSMTEFCYDLAVNELADLLFVPGKKLQAAKLDEGGRI